MQNAQSNNNNFVIESICVPFRISSHLCAPLFHASQRLSFVINQNIWNCAQIEKNLIWSNEREQKMPVGRAAPRKYLFSSKYSVADRPFADK